MSVLRWFQQSYIFGIVGFALWFFIIISTFFISIVYLYAVFVLDFCKIDAI